MGKFTHKFEAVLYQPFTFTAIGVTKIMVKVPGRACVDCMAHYGNNNVQKLFNKSVCNSICPNNEGEVFKGAPLSDFTSHLDVQFAVLNEVAKEYPGRTIENIIENIYSRLTIKRAE